MAITTPSILAALTALLGVGSAQAAPAAFHEMPTTPAHLAFTILMDGDPIGQEIYDFRQESGHTTVSVATKTDVKLLFLTFHYRHQRQEEWQGVQLQSIRADTDDDGSKHHLEAASQSGGLSLSVDGKPANLPAGSLPLSLWNKAVLGTDNLYGVIDAQPYHVSVQDLGPETLTMAGKPQDSHHYRIAGDIQRDLWFGADGLLLQASFERKGYPIKFIRE